MMGPKAVGSVVELLVTINQHHNTFTCNKSHLTTLTGVRRTVVLKDRQLKPISYPSSPPNSNMSSRNNPQAIKDDTVATEDNENREIVDTSRSRLLWRQCLCAASVLYVFLLIATSSMDFGMNPFFDFSFLFLVALVALVIRAAVIKTSNRDNDDQDFDAIIAQVAARIHEESKQVGGALEQPLLTEGNGLPANRIFHVEDRQFGITDKKSGEIFLEGSNTYSVLRLSFASSEADNGSSIQGTRSTASKTKNIDIPKGAVSSSTRKAYWEESSGGIRRVVTGQFDEDFLCFSGEWLASDGSRGSLLNIHNNELLVDYAVPMDESAPISRGNESALASGTNSGV